MCEVCQKKGCVCWERGHDIGYTAGLQTGNAMLLAKKQRLQKFLGL